MKYYKTLDMFKASNLTFNPKTNQAYSYDWYLMLTPTKFGLMFNSYNYSPTTVKHKAKVIALMAQMNAKITITIEAPRGLQDLEAARIHNVERLGEETVKNAHARIKSDVMIKHYNLKLIQLGKLGYKSSKAEVTQAVKNAEENRRLRLLQNKAKKVVVIPQVLA